MPLSPAAGAPSSLFVPVGRSRSAGGIIRDEMSGGGAGAELSRAEQLNQASCSNSAQGWLGGALTSWTALSLAALLAGGGAAVAQEGEDLEAPSRDPAQ